MKRSLIFLISSAIALVFGACNKHSWDEEIDGRIPTKEVFKPHGHGHGHEDGEGEHKEHKGHEGEGEEAHPKE